MKIGVWTGGGDCPGLGAEACRGSAADPGGGSGSWDREMEELGVVRDVEIFFG